MTEYAPVTQRRSLASEEAQLRRALQRFVEGRLRDRTDGEDIVQETYVRLYDYRRTRTVADVGAFCFAVARNLIHDHVRRRRTQPETAELPEDMACPAPLADELLIHRQRVELIGQSLRVMPALRREVFIRRRLEGQDSMAIASDLALSRAAVDKHVARALADIRTALERRGFAPVGRA